MLERLNFNLLEITKTAFTAYHRSKEKIWHLKSQTYSVFFHDRPQNKEKRFHWHPSFGRSQAILLPHVRLICCTFWRKCSSKKKYKHWTNNVNRHLSVFQKSLDQQISRPKWKQSSENIRGFQENCLGLLMKSTPFAFSHVPDQIAPSLKQGPFHSPFEPRKGWSFKHSFERDMEHSAWSFWDVFSLDFQCPLLSVSLLFWCWFAAILRNHEKQITSSKQLACWNRVMDQK